ncbi:AGAP002637-PA-like protein [Anopheles sinensis]|uniref:AGAP002637-PA-like protein n=1 Tax=Anopheles sinensis TaxID=74873 RepID=A0A084WUT0_ANOSI|nr:AGAP002637-PA-like protein [Anopheles sinensis]
MNLLAIVLSVFLTLVSLQLQTAFAATADECDPIYEEFTLSSECDFNCQNVCSPVTNVCLCKFGYLRDLTSNLCIAEDQCDPAPEAITFGCLAA